MKQYSKTLCIALLAAILISPAAATVHVAASLTDLASIAAFVGGDRVEAFSIAKSSADPHSVEVLPTYMVKVSRADLYLKVGLGLDQWADQIVDGSRNPKIVVTDCSQNISVLERPTGRVDASLGDVHPDGNPHYWLDPDNGIIIARTVAEALTRLDPAGGDVYQANLARFQNEMSDLNAQLKSRLDALPSRTIITYHSSWVYFANAFDLQIVDKIEPVPGIPPTGAHLAKLVAEIKSGQITIALQEPYFASDAAAYLARETGIRDIVISPSAADATPAAYADHFTALVNALLGTQP